MSLQKAKRIRTELESLTEQLRNISVWLNDRERYQAEDWIATALDDLERADEHLGDAIKDWKYSG